jgi:phytoene/squalene synthetase
MTITPEDILDELSTIIMDLGAIREQVTDTVDRSAINNQIKALTKWWRTIDDERAGQSNNEIDNAKKALVEITKDLKAEKKNLKKVAVVIHRAAQAIAIVEKVAKLVA